MPGPPQGEFPPGYGRRETVVQVGVPRPGLHGVDVPHPLPEKSDLSGPLPQLGGEFPEQPVDLPAVLVLLLHQPVVSVEDVQRFEEGGGPPGGVLVHHPPEPSPEVRPQGQNHPAVLLGHGVGLPVAPVGGVFQVGPGHLVQAAAQGPDPAADFHQGRNVVFPDFPVGTDDLSDLRRRPRQVRKVGPLLRQGGPSPGQAGLYGFRLPEVGSRRGQFRRFQGRPGLLRQSHGIPYLGHRQGGALHIPGEEPAETRHQGADFFQLLLPMGETVGEEAFFPVAAPAVIQEFPPDDVEIQEPEAVRIHGALLSRRERRSKIRR
ncbi:MAG: hypothetical protein BWY88_01258 [Synergistetes bacterium ADurb.Bin520]|nr:MAG: hypothetical protein BWY88_01258 [Synergistetes bacterium ADurb.Bin520]